MGEKRFRVNAGRRHGKSAAYKATLTVARALGWEVEEYVRACDKAAYAIIRPRRM